MNKEGRIESFTDLIVWQKGHQLALLIYKLIKDFPKEEMYALVNQMRRAAILVTFNIAEGFGRQTHKEKTQFYYMASGSLSELKNQILLARDLGHMETDRELFNLCNDIRRLLNALISSTKRRSSLTPKI